jgi:integrating conjugative element protein (TIGR03749 family)
VKNIIVFLTLALFLTDSTQATQLLHWERLPLSVSLIVAQERVVFIDRPVRIGMPASLEGRLRVQSAGGALYLRAEAPIESTRLQLQDVDTGALILLDITADPAAADQMPLEPVRIVDADSEAGPDSSASMADEHTARRSTSNTVSPRQTPVPVVLIRYAAQSLYTPLRTVEPIDGLSRAPLRRDMALETILPTLSVRASALAAWRMQDYWVTAIKLTHTERGWCDLDPRALQGDFIAATFQHSTLGPSGDPTDTTVLYLVTRKHGLAESLLPVISPVDAGERHEK